MNEREIKSKIVELNGANNMFVFKHFDPISLEVTPFKFADIGGFIIIRGDLYIMDQFGMNIMPFNELDDYNKGILTNMFEEDLELREKKSR